MTSPTLKALYSQHQGKVSLKWMSYLDAYDRAFTAYRNQQICLLELGVQNGGSLEIWAKYLPKAQKLVGCDIDPNCADLRFEDPRISCIVGDANADITQQAILKQSPSFDIVIDDASHRSGDILKAFNRYFPRLNAGGIYVIEDLHCSYWQEYEGGLFDPFSAITFFKRLVDVINHEHWGVEKNRGDILRGFSEKYQFEVDAQMLTNISAIEFVNSMCIIRTGDGLLGQLFVAGAEEPVASGHASMHLSEPMLIAQATNPWTMRSMPPDEELIQRMQELLEREALIIALHQAVAEKEEQIAALHQTVREKEAKIAALQQNVREKEAHIAALMDSTSWKITKPIRYVGGKLKK